MGESIGSKLDRLMDLDFSESSTDQILSIITGASNDQILSLITGGEKSNIPYVDLQSKEGFEVEVEKIRNQINSVVDSLNPGSPPIPIERIEDLACTYEGDSLYSAIILESLKTDEPDVYNSLINSDEFKMDNPITEESIGVSVRNINLGFRKVIPSGGMTKYLSKKNPRLLEKLNERLFDNISPTKLGKPTNAGSRKKRSLNIMGFKFPLTFIMNGKQIVHIKIGGDEVDFTSAISKINKVLKDQYSNSNPCDFKDFLDDGDDTESDRDRNKRGITSTDRADGFDANFYPDGDDPVQVDDDCFAGIPEDPITGDPIATKINFNNIIDDFCDTPPYRFQSVESQDPDVPDVDVDAIDSCLNSALDKTKQLEKDVKELSRWQNIERSLEEILYHYEPIYEYQKSLYESWNKRSSQESSGKPNDREIAIKALIYNDQLIGYRSDILKQKGDYKYISRLFLESSNLFNDRIFLIDINDTYLNSDELKILFQEKIDANISPIIYNEETKSWPIDDAVTFFVNNVDIIRNIINKKIFISNIESNIKQTNGLLESTISELSKRKGGSVSVNDLEKYFKPDDSSALDPFGQGKDTLFSIGSIFTASEGYDFTEALKEFSVRYETDFSATKGELKIKLSLPTDYGNPIPYMETSKPSKVTLKGVSSGISKIFEPDLQKIRLGNEYAGNGGLLAGEVPTYLKSYGFLEISNIRSGSEDVAEFYGYIEDVIDSDRSKEDIIQDIVDDRGILYGELIEKSSSNWLFFSAAERGDNDARDPAKNRPASFTDDGDPNPVFVDFYSNFKPKWDAKYIENKRKYIDPALKELKEKAKEAGDSLGNSLSTNDIVGIRIFENYLEIKRKYEQIKETMLFASQKAGSINSTITPEGVEKRFSDIKCSLEKRDKKPRKNNSVSSDAADTEDPNDPEDKENCPPVCCGNPGSDFKTDNYLTSSPPSSDCPTIFQKCWWKQFCKDVTKVGLLPLPNGLPPIEDKNFFLVGGPTLRMGLKYWPVGYLPPAFIPIPIPNPVDGAPYIRIPLPMVWTIVPPILIPLPFNLGIMVIFIPFIGGFMPTPLVYIKEFITGSSFFLTGIRGPRFIPRKSDPVIKDPFEKVKQMLSFGVPDKLIDLPGFGQDDLDLKDRVLGGLKSNLAKIMDSVPPPGNFQGIRDLQQKEKEIRKSISDKEREYKNSSALLDLPKPDFTQEIAQLTAMVGEKKRILTNSIKEYLLNSIPDPKTIYFPQDKNKLKIDIAGITRSIRILKDMQSSLVPIKCPDFINFKEEMREVLKLIKIVCPPRYAIENFEVSNSSKIYLRRNGDPRQMNEEEFNDLVRPVRRACLIITAVILWGNRFSTNKKIREGVFSIIEKGDYKGAFKFPAIKITNSAPGTLKFLRKRDPEIQKMRKRILIGLSRIEFNVEDFLKYVRYDGENPMVVLRVKDLKKLLSKKLGLSRITSNDPVRPLDEEDPLISRYPYPKGPLSCLESLNGGFGNAVSAFELPVQFPLKQDQYLQVPGLGGMVQIKISGKNIKKVLVELLDKSLSEGAIDNFFPEINDIGSSKFLNLSPVDLQKMSKNMVTDLIDPSSKNLPPIFSVLDKGGFAPSRPTDIIEQALIGLGAPPAGRMFYGLFWEYFKGLPKTPLSDLIVFPKLKASSAAISKLPWPLTVLLGRNVLNLLNPIIMNDDHPVWRRMSLRNSYYVVYIDEFLRSASDVSGLFKFFFGSLDDPTYPIAELPDELKKEFNVKKY